MKFFIRFSKALMSMPMPWPLWLGLLVVANFLCPIYFFAALEAKVVAATFLAGAAIMMAIFAAKGFVRLLGLGHILWVPMVPWLWTRLDQIEPGGSMAYWIGAVVALNGISLIIDAADVVRYVKGDREPYLPVAD